MIRLGMALIISPLILFILSSVIDSIARGNDLSIERMIGMFPFFYVFTFLGVIIIGLPVYLLFKRFNILNLINIAIIGGLSGIVFLYLVIAMFTSKFLPIEAEGIINGFQMGALTAFVFGILAGVPFFSTRKNLLKHGN